MDALLTVLGLFGLIPVAAMLIGSGMLMAFYISLPFAALLEPGARPGMATPDKKEGDTTIPFEHPVAA